MRGTGSNPPHVDLWQLDFTCTADPFLGKPICFAGLIGGGAGRPILEKTLECEVGGIEFCNFAAASGAYVDPDGRLSVVATTAGNTRDQFSNPDE